MPSWKKPGESSPITTATAPGKVILCGEHAVVYGRPAIAVPVFELVATARVWEADGGGCQIYARDLNRRIHLSRAPAQEPLALVAALSLEALDLPPDPSWRMEVHSEIPMASGLGSGAAVSTALARAIFRHAGAEPPPETISAIVFRSEEIHHGTPSGIDNTVIAYERPVWFVRGTAPEIFRPGHPFTLAIADSGISSPTAQTVGDVRRGWQQDPERHEVLFDEIGSIVGQVRGAIEGGKIGGLGGLLDRNQTLLAQLGVSSAPLERLVRAARQAGAAGAKLSGGGRGGNVIALVDDDSQAAVSAALLDAGAARVLVTEVTADRSAG